MKYRYGIISVCTVLYSSALCYVVALYAQQVVTPVSYNQGGETLTEQALDFMVTHRREYQIEPSVPPLDQQPLDVQLMRTARRHAPSGHLIRVLDAAQEKFKNDTEGYLKFITERDEDGWMALHHYIVDGDAEHVRYILERVSTFFGDDFERYATFLMVHDKQGMSPLLASLRQQQFEITEMLVQSAEKIFGHDKLAFFKFINKRDFGTGKTALVFAAYNNWIDVVQMLVESAARVFGTKSSYFERFINAKDMYGRTSVTYGNNRIDRLLQKYGGTGEVFTGEVG